VTFTRLTRGDLLAMVAALALLLTMALDWWTTAVGENARDVQGKVLPQIDRDTTPSISQKEAEVAEGQEKNAWQASALIDRVILVALMAAALLALLAAWARAAGRSIGPPSPSALATLAGLLASLLLVYRILQPPGLNAAAVVKAGAPLGLLCVGLLTIGARIATRREGEERRAPAGEERATPAISSPP
jgi:hypothetical protein